MDFSEAVKRLGLPSDTSFVNRIVRFDYKNRKLTDASQRTLFAKVKSIDMVYDKKRVDAWIELDSERTNSIHLCWDKEEDLEPEGNADMRGDDVMYRGTVSFV